MTRDEAIMVLKNEQPHCGKKALFPEEKKYEAYDMAIKALEQEPCEDAIRRDELLKAMDTWDKFGYTETGCFVREPKNDCVKYIHYDDVIKCIKGMPSVTPQQKMGRWVLLDECANSGYYCSECHKKLVKEGWSDTVKKIKYCPNCGCAMKGEEE